MVGSAGMGELAGLLRAVESGARGTNLVGRVLADTQGRRGRRGAAARAAATWCAACSAANRHLVEALRDALLERDELIGHEITDVLRAAGPVRPAAVAVAVGAPSTIDLTSGPVPA